MTRPTKCLLLTLAGVVAVIAGAIAAGARINSTASYPVGLYWSVDTPPVHGELVIFCPPKQRSVDDAKRRGYVGAGFCPGGYGYLIKKIVAEKNAIVEIADSGVFVNGNRIPNSTPATMDSTGQPLPRIRIKGQTLGDDEVLLISDFSPRSFDGRYFGVIDKSHIRSVIRPVFTW